jgi:hypothetical protein
MNPMRLLLTLCLLAWLPAVMGAPNPKADVLVHEASGFHFPRIIGDFGAEDVTPAGAPEAGVSLKYKAPGGVWAEIQLTPAPAGDAPLSMLGPVPAALAKEFEAAKAAFLAAPADGTPAPTPGKEERFRPGNQELTPVGLKLPASLRRGNDKVERQLLLFEHNGHFLRLTISYPNEMRRDAEPAIKRFLNDLPWPKPNQSQVEAETARIQAAITEFLADPLKAKDALELVKSFARDSSRVQVVVSQDMLGWVSRGRQVRHADLLVGAFVAGNVKAQLERQVCANDAVAGITTALAIYQMLQKAEPGYKVSELDAYQTMVTEGKLAGHLHLLELLANPPYRIQL